MKYKMFVFVDGIKSQIAQTDNFSDLQNIMNELEKFKTEWEVTENNVRVFSTISTILN